MKILKFEPLDKDFILVAETPSPEVIKQKLTESEWELITRFRLVIDELNWIDLSGAHGHGFSIVYSDGENEWLVKNGLESLEQGILVVQSYAMKGSEWKELLEWEHFNQAGAKAAGCASMIILLFILTSILTVGTYSLLMS